MGVRRLDHVGITVSDLDAAIEFFLDIGLELEMRMPVEGEWLENIIAIEGVREDIAMMRTPDGSGKVELGQFHTPVDDQAAEVALANRLGLRNVAFVVDDVPATVDRLASKGYELIGKIQNFEDVFLICYVRGPDGITVSLNQELK
jgi:catechol 2,3-dioxygenase-like lactoylglutathione lyase family enzyme